MVRVSAVLAAAICFAIPGSALAADPSPPPTPQATDVKIDNVAIAEKQEIRAKGRRMLIGGWVCAGTMLALSTSSLVLWYGFEHVNGTLATSSTALALGAVAIPLAVAGSRRVKRPEKFMKRRDVAVAPSFSPRHVGASFSLRF